MILPAIGRAILTVGSDTFTVSSESADLEPYRFEKYCNLTPIESRGTPVPDGTDLDSIREMVSTERDRRDFVFFFLASLDRSLGPELQLGAAQFVEDILGHQQMEEFAHDLLLSEPFHPTIDASLKLEFPELTKYANLVREAIAHQPAIALFWRSWLAMVEDTDPLAHSFDLGALRDLLLRSGLVSRFVRSIYAADRLDFNRHLVSFTLSREAREEFGTAPQLLNKLKNILDKLSAFRRSQLALAGLTSSEYEEVSSTRVAQNTQTLSDHDVYSRVTQQIENIKGLLFTGAQGLVDKAIRELLEFQRLHSDQEYLAKTLCNLATTAIDANQVDLAQGLAEEVGNLGIDDVVADSVRAEVLKSLGRFAEAKFRYESALLKYGESRYLLNGLADVLKDCGEFQRSLSLYEKAEQDYPDDPVAPNGISTVYLAMGQPNKALARAQRNIATFGDPVSRIICGNILRHLGRNHESLTLMEGSVRLFGKELGIWSGYIRSLSLVGRYESALAKCEECIAIFPKAPLPRYMHGELLRKMGRLQESLSSFNRSLNIFQMHRGLQMGKATALLLLGKAAEAAELINTSDIQSERDWMAYQVWASSHARLGDYAKALEALQWGLANVPWRNLRSLFSDMIGYVKLRAGDHRAAIETFREGLKTADTSKRNGLCLLLSRAYSEIGRISESARYLEQVNSAESAVMRLKAATKPGLRLVRDSARESQEIEQSEFQIFLAAA